MAVREIGAAARRSRVRRGCGHDGSDGAADGEQGEHDERRVEERTSRPVGERAARAAERRDDQASRGAPARPSPRGRGAARQARGRRGRAPATIVATPGTSAHGWGWFVRRVDAKASRANPAPRATSALPMICGSLPPAKTPRTSRRPSASPAAIEARTTSPMWPARGGLLSGRELMLVGADCCGHEFTPSLDIGHWCLIY